MEQLPLPLEDKEPTQEVQQPTQQQSVEAELRAALAEFGPKAPTQAKIEEWKAEHGEIFLFGFSELELFIWRPLARLEFKVLQVEGQEQQMSQFQFEEKICDTCVLWRSINIPWDKTKAGTIQTLHEQILQRSNFIGPAAAGMLVVKL